ncbi:MAG: hypothetical protein RID53_35680 [Coleofasciculus sp. B1-GNL1-01]|uniref:hypothetical protein n=1 Tax=Coleofasciculus sp. B1-GNL1-01 TaxID=3068484 RepID=UPI003300F598
MTITTVNFNCVHLLIAFLPHCCVNDSNGNTISNEVIMIDKTTGDRINELDVGNGAGILRARAREGATGRFRGSDSGV